MCQPLNANPETGFVHHDEHGFQTTVFFTHQKAGGFFIVHNTCGIAVDAHLMFQRSAGHGVPLTGVAISVQQVFGGNEQGNPVDAFGGTLNSGQNQMDDVLGHVVFTSRDPDLLTGDLVCAVLLGNGFGTHHAQIGSAMRLGQVHCA